MKKLFLFVFASVTYLYMTAENKEVTICPSRQTTSCEGTKHPRTPEPSIEAYMGDGVITLYIDRFMGSVATTIDDSSDNTVVTDFQYMSGSKSYTIDVSSLAADTYTIYLTFSDGREYYGTFSIE